MVEVCAICDMAGCRHIRERECGLIPIPPADAARANQIDPQAVIEAMEDNAGAWITCCGCHESNEGYPTGPYSTALQCTLGAGCHECGGLGAVWDTTDYAAMAAEMVSLAAQPVAQEPVADGWPEVILPAAQCGAKLIGNYRYIRADLAHEAVNGAAMTEAFAFSAGYEAGERDGKASATPVPEPMRLDAAWQDLLDKDDRTSPEEYPDMALITRAELADYMRATPAPVEAGLREIEEMLAAGQGDDDGPAILPDMEGLSTVAKVEACLSLLERRRDAIAGFEAAFVPGTVANAARVLLDLLHVRGDHHKHLSQAQVQSFHDEVAQKEGFDAVVAALDWLVALRAQSAPVGGPAPMDAISRRDAIAGVKALSLGSRLVRSKQSVTARAVAMLEALPPFGKGRN